MVDVHHLVRVRRVHQRRERVTQRRAVMERVELVSKSDVPVQLPPEPEFVPAKRARRAPPADLGQPLQMVETGKKD